MRFFRPYSFALELFRLRVTPNQKMKKKTKEGKRDPWDDIDKIFSKSIEEFIGCKKISDGALNLNLLS